MTEQRAGTRIEVLVNGEPRAVDGGTRIADLVDPAWGRGIAVARNGEVVPHAEWDRTGVEAGDEIEIVHPIQGGCG
jgi:sulfur carrier protein